jgi:hypothetical protein
MRHSVAERHELLSSLQQWRLDAAMTDFAPG